MSLKERPARVTARVAKTTNLIIACPLYRLLSEGVVKLKIEIPTSEY